MSALAKAGTRSVAFALNVRVLDTAGRCVRTIPVDGLSAQVPLGQASARVDGCLVVDDLETPFRIELPTQRGRVTLDLDFQPRAQFAKQFSRARVVGGSGQVVEKMTYSTRDPIPRSVQVRVQGQEQFWTTLSRR